MLIEILVILFAGVIAGTFTGLIPGIHVNLIGAILISLTTTSALYQINPIYIVVFIVSMAITHTFVDFIPSVFLGCPDTDTELSILPGHKLLKEGLGYEAIMLTNYGSLAAIFILILIAFPSIFIIQKTYPILQKIIPYILILTSILLISFEKQKIKSIFIFILSGALGYIALTLGNSDLLKEPLLPLLTGLFGASTLLLSIKTTPKIPKQISETTITKKQIIKPLFGAAIAAPLCSFLPGLGSGQAAVIGNKISPTDEKGFLTLVGATNTLVMGFSFIALYTISRTRTGAAAAIEKILGIPPTKTLILILLIAFIVGIFSFYLTKFLAKIFANNFHKINYKT